MWAGSGSYPKQAVTPIHRSAIRHSQIEPAVAVWATFLEYRTSGFWCRLKPPFPHASVWIRLTLIPQNKVSFQLCVVGANGSVDSVRGPNVMDWHKSSLMLANIDGLKIRNSLACIER